MQSILLAPVSSPVIPLTEKVYLGIDSVVDATLELGCIVRPGETMAVMGGVYCDDLKEALRALHAQASGGFWTRFWNKVPDRVVQVSQKYAPRDVLEVTAAAGAGCINVKYGNREMCGLPRSGLDAALETVQRVQEQVINHVKDTYWRRKDTPESSYWKKRDPRLQELYGFKTQQELEEIGRTQGVSARIDERFRPIIAQADHFASVHYMKWDGTFVRRRNEFRIVSVREIFS